MKRRSGEAGFAMLLVYLMAALIAITLYMEIPRVAFEAERQRELLLIDRGNQFKRAIQVFVTDKTNNPTRRYPASLDELENFNNHRYLRRRYLDPMTGKDEWRLIHINGGVLTDSVTTQQQKPTNANGQSGSGSSGSSYITEQAYMDVPTGADGSTTGGVNRALNRRPSETAGAPGDPNNPGGPGGMPGDGSGGVPGGTGANSSGVNAPSGLPGIPGLPGQQPGGSGLSGTASGTDQSGQQSGQQSGGGSLPGIQPGVPGGSPFGTTGGGMGANGQPNVPSAASAMLANLLTSPRPGGMPTNTPGSTIGGGIAGVASNYKAEGIMVINQRTKINEWEYIFDFTKWRPPPNPIAGAVGNPQQQMQGQGTGNNNNPNSTGNSPNSTGFGGGIGPIGH